MRETPSSEAPSALSEPRPSVARAAGAMGIATFLSRILGLLREQLFAYLFGASHATDAFQVAFRIPNLLRDLFAEGAMSAALVPVFTQVREKEGQRRAWRVAGLVFRVLLVVVSILAGIGIVISPQLVNLYASAFRSVEGKFELTVQMTQLLFPFFPMVALAAAFMGVLNSCGKFFVPAFSSALFNLVSIIVGGGLALLLPRWTGSPAILGMAIGVLAGGAIQVLSQVPTLLKVGYRWLPRSESDPVWHRDPALKRILSLMGPGFLGLAATQINVLINTVLATQAMAGAVSWLNYAFRLMQFPIGVFGVSMAAATQPAIARLWVNRDVAGVCSQLNRSLRQVFALNLPASVGLAFLGVPIVALLFEYGQFQPADTLQTAHALAAYSLGLTAYSAVKVLVPACYAIGNTRSAVVSSLISIATTAVLNVFLVKWLGHAGLALGTSVAAVLNAVYLYVRLGGLLAAAGGHLDGRAVLSGLLQHSALALLMGAVCWATWAWGMQPISAVILSSVGEGIWNLFFVRLTSVFLLIFEAGVVLVLFARLFRVEETLEATHFFWSRVKNKLKRAPIQG